ncbi:hypothetical protein lbkm_3263 [Lachnospiraceae bacterium KM106-2]|nr:hypothetical protein lbkm_3263 [Lachnospiraceae bacterium KM106-2]
MADHVFNKNQERESQRKELLKALYVNRNAKTENRIFMCNKIGILLWLMVITNVLCLLLGVFPSGESIIKNGKYIERPGYGQNAESIDLHVIVNEEKEDTIDESIGLALQPRIYTKQEFDERVPMAKKYIKKNILKNNQSLHNIRSSLNLMSRIPGTALQVKWELNSYVNTDGTLNNQKLDEKGKEVEVGVTLSSGSYESEFKLALKILPAVKSNKEKLLEDLQEKLVENDRNTNTKTYTELPNKINGKTVSYIEEKSDLAITIMCYGVFLIIILSIGIEHRLQEQMKKRELQLLLDYPELVNRFLLLTNAGMTVKRAWGKLVSEYQDHCREGKGEMRYAYEEMIVTWYELQNGTSEIKAYESFGRRISLAPYLKFSSMLAQNVKKGLQEMNQKLESEAINAFENRKEVAKRLGEQASTKMLLPMGIMLVLVLVIILVPAILSFNF